MGGLGVVGSRGGGDLGGGRGQGGGGVRVVGVRGGQV